MSGGNLSVLSCPCGYNTVDHSPVSKKDQYDHVELPINLMQMPFDSVSSTEGAPWYTFFCTHRVVDGITRKEIALTESTRISAKNERIAHLDAMPEHSDDTIIVFLFLVYHSLDNEELWKVSGGVLFFIFLLSCLTQYFTKKIFIFICYYYYCKSVFFVPLQPNCTTPGA